MKKLLSIVLSLTVILISCAILTSCSNTNQLVGRWIPDTKTNSYYPEHYLLLNESGSGEIDGYDCVWFAEGEKLTIKARHSFMSKTFEYRYKVSWDKLTLNDFTFTKEE